MYPLRTLNPPLPKTPNQSPREPQRQKGIAQGSFLTPGSLFPKPKPKDDGDDDYEPQDEGLFLKGSSKGSILATTSSTTSLGYWLEYFSF